jgi:hypothetical protein
LSCLLSGFNFQARFPGDVDRLDPGFIETTNEGLPDRQKPHLFSEKFANCRQSLDSFDP